MGAASGNEDPLAGVTPEMPTKNPLERDTEPWYRPVGSTAEVYNGLTTMELRLLLERRVDQIKELREIHERTHLAAEQTYRRQLLDYDDKSLFIGDKIQSRALQNIQWCRAELNREREAEFYKMRDQTICVTIFAFWLMGYWFYLVRHYPYIPEKVARKTLMHSSRVSGNFLNSGKWYARDLPTDFDKELERRKKAEQEELAKQSKKDPDTKTPTS
jgi:hypothetical protein